VQNRTPQKAIVGREQEWSYIKATPSEGGARSFYDSRSAALNDLCTVAFLEVS
jgi:hypothetical protein